MLTEVVSQLSALRKEKKMLGKLWLTLHHHSVGVVSLHVSRARDRIKVLWYKAQDRYRFLAAEYRLMTFARYRSLERKQVFSLPLLFVENEAPPALPDALLVQQCLQSAQVKRHHAVDPWTETEDLALKEALQDVFQRAMDDDKSYVGGKRKSVLTRVNVLFSEVGESSIVKMEEGRTDVMVTVNDWIDGHRDEIQWEALVPDRSTFSCQQRWFQTLDPRLAHRKSVAATIQCSQRELFDRMHRGTKKWTKEEDQLILMFTSVYGVEHGWNFIASRLPMVRTEEVDHHYRMVLDPTLRKKVFYTQEESLRVLLVDRLNIDKWEKKALFIPGRTTVSLNEHWTDQLSPLAVQSKSVWSSREVADLMDVAGSQPVWATVRKQMMERGHTERTRKAYKQYWQKHVASHI